MGNEYECEDDCASVMKELRKFEDKYESKVQEYELQKIRFNSTLSNVARNVSTLDKTTSNLSDAIISHMKEEETHHIAVATALAKIEEALKSKPSQQDMQDVNVAIETQKGRVTTLWIIGATVVTAALGMMAFTALYIKEDIVKKIEENNRAHEKPVGRK